MSERLNEIHKGLLELYESEVYGTTSSENYVYNIECYDKQQKLMVVSIRPSTSPDTKIHIYLVYTSRKERLPTMELLN